MKTRFTLIALALGLIACSKTTPYTGEKVSKSTTSSGATITQYESRSMMASGELAGTDAAMVQATAKVESVNHSSRELALERNDGRIVKITAGPQVRNLNQIKPGDTVRVSYIESVDFQVRKPTADELAIANRDRTTAARARLGERPMGLLGSSRLRVLEVDDIDKENSLLTLKDGSQRFTVKAKYPQNLATAKVGDTLVVTVAEIIAADIQPQ